MNTHEEIWKDFPGYEGRYQGSNLGNVRSIRNGKTHILKPTGDKKHRDRVSIYRNGIAKMVLVNNFIWMCFNGNIPAGYEIHHIDFDCYNNSIENLQMLSKEEHRLIHGNYKKKIECYDLDGNLVAEYDSIAQAAKSVGHLEHACHIKACCNGNYKYAYGFVWKYKN